MPDYSFSQYTILISAYTVLVTVGPLSSTQLTDIYVAAAAISQKLPPWLALHKEKAGDNLMPQPCA